MAQSGFTPILIYGSGSTGNTPAAGNLTTSASGVELALNYFDGKLFYKDNAGVVQVLAVKMPSGVLPIANGGTNATATPTAGAVAYGTGTAYAFTAVGTAGQPLLSNAGSAPAFGTLGVAGGGTGLTSLTANRIPYGAGTSAFANSANLTFDGSTLTVNSVNVGRGAGSVATNTAVGATSLNANTTGARNTAFGVESLQANTTSNDSTALGYRALYVSTGTQNTAVGSGALDASTTADNNTAVGYQAGYGNTTGSSITVIGRQAGYNNTTGVGNICIGDQAGFSNTAGDYNIFIGVSAGYTYNGVVNTGSNTVIGSASGYSITSGVDNVIFGGRAAYSINTGSRNVIIGRMAGYSLTSGTNNTFVGPGEWDGGSGTLSSGGVITTGSKNTILGRYTGNQGGLDIRTASNYIVLSDGDGNPRQVIDGSGNVGIGALAPITRLDVLGAAALYNNTTSGNTLSAELLLANRGNLSAAANTAAKIAALSGSVNWFDSTSLVFYTNPGPDASANVAVESMRLTGAGNLIVGNGTTAASPRSVSILGTSGSGTNIAGASLTIEAGKGTGSGAGGAILFRTAAAGSSGSSLNTASERARLASDGEFSVANGTQSADTISSVIKLGNRGTQSSSAVGAAAIKAISGTGNWFAGTSLAFYTNPGPDVTAAAEVERMRITSSGNLLVGTTTNNASGGVIQVSNGITFPATQSASTDANTLDDYEEGTWTPVLADGTNNATMTAGTSGRYTKIGNLVSIQAIVGTSSLGSVTGDIRITGLPFSSAASIYAGVTVGYAEGLAITSGQSVGFYVGPSSNVITLQLWDSTIGTTPMQATEWSADGGVIFSFSYRV